MIVLFLKCSQLCWFLESSRNMLSLCYDHQHCPDQYSMRERKKATANRGQQSGGKGLQVAWSAARAVQRQSCVIEVPAPREFSLALKRIGNEQSQLPTEESGAGRATQD